MEEDLSDAVSLLSMQDNFSCADSKVSSFGSVLAGRSQAARDNLMSPSKKKSYRGTTEMVLPYLLDEWTCSMGKSRISIQVQIPSGNDANKQITTRVSASKRELIVGFPMSPFLSRSDYAFTIVMKEQTKFKSWDDSAIQYLLQNHSKTTARIRTVKAIKDRSNTKQFLYYQRIPLPKKVRHTFATASDGDEVFHGSRYSVCPDGSYMLHVELIVDVGDNYCPEERMLDAEVMASYNITPSGPARMLDSIPERESRGAKRACRDHEEEMSVASGDKSVGSQSQYAPYAETAHLASPTPQALQQHTAFMRQQILEAQMRQAMQSPPQFQKHVMQHHMLQQQNMQQHAMQQRMMQQHAMQQQATQQKQAAQQQNVAQNVAQKMASSPNQKPSEKVIDITETPPPKVPHIDQGISPDIQAQANNIMTTLDAELNEN
jgi:hypothetical protein